MLRCLQNGKRHLKNRFENFDNHILPTQCPLLVALCGGKLWLFGFLKLLFRLYYFGREGKFAEKALASMDRLPVGQRCRKNDHQHLCIFPRRFLLGINNGQVIKVSRFNLVQLTSGKYSRPLPLHDGVTQKDVMLLAFVHDKPDLLISMFTMISSALSCCCCC